MPLNLKGFYIANLPRIDFGDGAITRLPGYIAEFGRKVLLVTGGDSLRQKPQWSQLLEELDKSGIEAVDFSVNGEPSPRMVDEAVAQYSKADIDAVVGIGGGSALDAAKAIAGLLPGGNSVLDYLEDVGKGLPYEGPALPFIAVPTTAGTGSEATKNSVLSEHGDNGYKKSFRHEMLVARIAVVDPQLLEGCPKGLIAAQGMDAFTQLLESYVSIKANPFTDALAWSGLEAVARGFYDAWCGGDSDAAKQGRAAMAYGALISGITLAQVGLGSVHGLAQPLGSLFPIPHGVACGTTLAPATEVNLKALRERNPESPALHKYAKVGRLLAADESLSDEKAADCLVEILTRWADDMALPGLHEYGVTEADLPRIVANSRGNSMKSNPVELSDEKIAEIVRARL